MFFSASISPKTGAGRLTRWRTQRTRFASKTFQSSTWWSWTSQRQLQSARQTLAKWERSGFSRCGFSGGGGVRYWWDGRDRWDRWDRRKDVQRTLWRHRCNEALWAKLPTQSIHLVHLVHLAWGRTWSAPRAPSEVTSAVAHVAQRWFATGGGNARRPKSVREVGRGLGAQRLAPGAAETCWNWMSYGVWIKWGWKCRIVYVDTGGYWWILRKLLYYIVFICILVFLRYLGHAFGGNAGQVSSLTGRSIAFCSAFLPCYQTYHTKPGPSYSCRQTSTFLRDQYASIKHIKHTYTLKVFD